MTRSKSNRGTCKSCGADITWVTLHPRGGGKPKPHPVDTSSIEKGRLVLSATGPNDEIKAGVRPTAVSHFATCPAAGKHRNGGD